MHIYIFIYICYIYVTVFTVEVTVKLNAFMLEGFLFSVPDDRKTLAFEISS